MVLLFSATLQRFKGWGVRSATHGLAPSLPHFFIRYLTSAKEKGWSDDLEIFETSELDHRIVDHPPAPAGTAVVDDAADVDSDAPSATDQSIMNDLISSDSLVIKNQESVRRGPELDVFRLPAGAQSKPKIEEFPELLEKLQQGKFYTETYKERIRFGSKSYLHEDPTTVGGIRPPWKQVSVVDRAHLSLTGSALAPAELRSQLKQLDPSWMIERNPSTGMLTLLRAVIAPLEVTRIEIQKNVRNLFLELESANVRVEGPRFETYDLGLKVSIPSSVQTPNSFSDADIRIAQGIDRILSASSDPPPGYTDVVDQYFDHLYSVYEKQHLGTTGDFDIAKAFQESELASKKEIQSFVKDTIAESTKAIRKHSLSEREEAELMAKYFAADVESLMKDVEELAKSGTSSDMSELLSKFIENVKETRRQEE